MFRRVLKFSPSSSSNLLSFIVQLDTTFLKHRSNASTRLGSTGPRQHLEFSRLVNNRGISRSMDNQNMLNNDNLENEKAV